MTITVSMCPQIENVVKVTLNENFDSYETSTEDESCYSAWWQLHFTSEWRSTAKWTTISPCQPEEFLSEKVQWGTAVLLYQVFSESVYFLSCASKLFNGRRKVFAVYCSFYSHIYVQTEFLWFSYWFKFRNSFYLHMHLWNYFSIAGKINVQC